MQTSLRDSAIKGMAWTGAERLVRQILQFFISLVMARLLMPSDYGVVGMLAIFLSIANTFQDSGFSSALIQNKNRTDVDYSTVFYFNLVVAAVFYALFFCFAPCIASFYATPELKLITRVVALSLVINALCSVQQTRLTIELKFGVQAILSITTLLISSAIGVFFAYRGYGAWALVYQSIIGGVANATILWAIARWHPKFVFSWHSFKRHFGFGSKLLCSRLINTVYSNIYTLVIGKAFGPAEIGHFNRANGFAAMPTNALTEVVMKVNYPILSRLQDDTGRLITAYKRLLKTPLFLLVPVLFGMAAVAEPMVRTLIGDKWLPCVPFLQVLCLGMMWNPLTHINLNLLYVKGRTDLVLKLELIKKPIAFMILFSMLPLGIFWMCVGKAAYDFIAFCFNCHYTKKVLGYGFWPQMRDILPIVANAVIMAIVAWFATKMGRVPFTQLILGVGAGFFAYLCGAILYREESLIYIGEIVWGKVRNLFNGR